MAQTTNIGLYKLGAQSKLKDFPSLFNDDMDIIDSSLGYGFGQSSNPTVKASIDAVNSENIAINSRIGSLSNLISPLTSSIVDAINSLLYANASRTEYNANANSYTDPGVYYFATGCLNVPGDYCVLLNISHSTFKVQLAVTAGSRDKLYMRNYAGGSWTAWKSTTFT